MDIKILIIFFLSGIRFIIFCIIYYYLPIKFTSTTIPFLLRYPVSKDIILVMVLNLPLLIRNKNRT